MDKKEKHLVIFFVFRIVFNYYYMINSSVSVLILFSGEHFCIVHSLDALQFEKTITCQSNIYTPTPTTPPRLTHQRENTTAFGTCWLLISDFASLEQPFPPREEIMTAPVRTEQRENNGAFLSQIDLPLGGTSHQNNSINLVSLDEHK